jgi:hypothetical protein
MLKRILSLLAVFMVALMGLAVVGAQDDDTTEIQMVGEIEARTADTITVNGHMVDVSTAEINAALTVGALVRVEGWLNDDDTITGRKVSEVDDEGILPDEIELVGVLDSYSGTTLVVAGQTIDVSRASIDDAVAVGEQVQIHATLNAQGIWVARVVEFASDDDDVDAVDMDDDDGFAIVGTLEQIDAQTLNVSGQTISLVDAEVHGVLLVGALVTVEGSRDDDVLVAAEVELAHEDRDDNGDSDDEIGTPAITAQRAAEIALTVYPNATVVRIELTIKFGGTLVWEVKLTNRIELNIDAGDGTILTIDRPSDDDDNGNDNGDDNGNDNGDDNGNDNDDDNGNDNDDDNDNDNDDD